MSGRHCYDTGAAVFNGGYVESVRIGAFAATADVQALAAKDSNGSKPPVQLTGKRSVAPRHPG